MDGFQNSAWRKGLAAIPDLWEQRFKVWNRPRENVWWDHAVAYGCWLSAKAQQAPDLLPLVLRGRSDVRIMLPTEWQWEKAASGWHGRLYPWGDHNLSGYTNVDEIERGDGPNFLEQTSPVGMYPHGASIFGVLDLSGNVWEWCLNGYDRPQNVQEGGNKRRVLRGGSWISCAERASVAARDVEHFYPDGGGFRVVCAASP